MRKNEALFIAYSNTKKGIESLLKGQTNCSIKVRTNDGQLPKNLEKIIGGDRPRAIIYDGNLTVTDHLKSVHEHVQLFISRYDVDCKVYSFEKLLDLPGITLITKEELNNKLLEPA